MAEEARLIALSTQYLHYNHCLKKRTVTTRYFLPVKTKYSTCELASSTTGTLFLCCVCVVNQNTRALLLAAHCYYYAT